MSNVLTYVIRLNDMMTSTLKKVGASTDTTTKKLHSMDKQVDRLNKKGLSGFASNMTKSLLSIPTLLIAAGFMKLKQSIQQSEQAYNLQSVAESRLFAVMRNMMDARKEDLKSILDLTAAQQKLGIIGDEIQLSGAQELSTYLTKTDSLKTLIPVLNDMLAQQYGLNVSQEQAQNIATMLGKVMDGQVGALSRYGYKFDEAQEKILKFGTESQRAAVLADVVSSAVGGVNAALAKTPEGILKQQANDLGDMQERVGKLVVIVKSAFSAVSNTYLVLSNRIVSFFERNQERIQQIIMVVSNIVVGAMNLVFNVVKFVFDIFNQYKDVILGVMAAILTYKAIMLGTIVVIKTMALVTAGVKAALIAYEIVVFAIKNATSLWTAAQWLLNTALSANPIGLIVAGVVALIALIAFLIIKVDGWRETWDNVVKFCSLVFESFKMNLQLKWMQIQDFFMTGLEVIEKGWYKLQSLWNEDAANAGLAKLEAQRNERAKEILATQEKLQELNNQMANMEVFKLKVNDTTFSDVFKGFKNMIGISTPGIPGATGSGGSGTSGDGTGGDLGKETANSIATGGSKTTHITINLGELVGSININKNGFRESAENMRDIVLDEMTRVLSMAQGQTI